METSTEGGYEDSLTEVVGRAEDLPPSLAWVSSKAPKSSRNNKLMSSQSSSNLQRTEPRLWGCHLG